MFIVLGVILLLAGAAILGLDRLHIPFGRLPGDMQWRGRNWSVSFPLATSLLLSVLLTLLLWIVGRIRR
jgi:hypothetical protein